MEVAAEANVVATELMGFISHPLDRPKVAALIARLVNLGIRCSPRAVQGTVRINAVRRAVEGLPVRVRLEKRTDGRTGRSYNALVTEPVGGVATVEEMSDE